MLTITQRSRIIQLYLVNNMHWSKYKYENLKRLASRENINVTILSLRRIIQKWICYRIVGDMPSINRDIKNTKVTEQELKQLDRKVFKQRHLSAAKLRAKIQIRASTRTVQKYLNLLGI